MTTAVTTDTVRAQASAARAAALRLAAVDTERKNAALRGVAEALERHADEIFAANRADVDRARADDLSQALIKRLVFDGPKLAEVVRGLRDLVSLPDPTGRTEATTELDDGLVLYRVTVPIGVVGVIFESRPDALVQISSLCLKSGNAVILKGGSEAEETNRVLARVIADAAAAADPVFRDAVQFIATREEVGALLALDDLVQLIIPRGSNALVRFIREHTDIPVLGHTDGICHVYVDAAADPAMAGEVVFDSKCQYPAVCNAMETLLVHRDAAPGMLPPLLSRLAAAGVELRGCERTRAIAPSVQPATEDDWRTEYLDMILSVRVVDSLDAAIDHVNTYGSHHTDAIVTGDTAAAEAFMTRVDSASVLHNCSTRFADGFRYGLGAEVGISTNKIHARGPVGLEGLVVYQYRLVGEGHVVAAYTGDAGRRFHHRALSTRWPPAAS